MCGGRGGGSQLGNETLDRGAGVERERWKVVSARKVRRVRNPRLGNEVRR